VRKEENVKWKIAGHEKNAWKRKKMTFDCVKI